MKSLKTLLAIALLSVGTSAMAQETEQAQPKYEFNPHWFIQLQGGAAYTLGEAKFKDLISPAAQLGIGYQFTPWFGLRGAFNGWESKGGWVNPKQTYKWNYVGGDIDFMFNLSNAICGFNPKRFFNLSAFIGGGGNYAFSNDDANALVTTGVTYSTYNLEYLWDGSKIRAVGRGGIIMDFRISDAVAFTLEGNANVLNDHYNSKKAGNADWYFNALAGFRINLGKTYKVIEPVVPTPAPEPAPEPVVEQKVEPAPAPVEVKKETLRRDVFFKINQFKIAPTETSKVKDIADFLNSHSDAKVTVTGYADAGTGTNAINDKIAAKRADTVVKALENQYKISADRITYDSKGAREQPFSENDKNRVSICIAE